MLGYDLCVMGAVLTPVQRSLELCVLLRLLAQQLRVERVTFR